MRIIPGPKYQDSKQRANCCSKFTYWYANTLISSVNLNGGKMDKVMVENMSDDPHKADKLLKYFQAKLKSNEQNWQKKNPGR